MKKEVNNDSAVQPVDNTIESSKTKAPKEEVVQTPEVPQPAVPKKGLGKGIIALIVAGVIVFLAIIGLVIASAVTGGKTHAFKSEVNNSFKALDNAIDEYDDFVKKFDIANKGFLVKGSVKFDTNVSDNEDIELLKKLTLEGSAGIDVKNEKLYVSASAKGNKENLKVSGYYVDGSTYIDASFLEDIVKVSDEDIDFEDLEDALKELQEQLEKTDAKTYKSMTKALKKAVNKTISSKNIKQTKGKFEVDGKSVSATKNSLVLDEDALEEMITVFCDELLNDEKFLNNVADTFDVDKGDVKDLLKELKEEAEDIDLDEDIVINIYTKGLFHNAVGYSIEVDEKEYVTFFTNGKKAEFTIDNHVRSDYSKVKLVVNFEKTKEGNEFTAKYNGTKIASGTIREFSDKLIDFDVAVTAGSENIKVSVYLSKKEDKKSITGEYKFKVTIDGEYIGVSGEYGIEIGDLPSVNTGKAVDLEDLDEEELMDSLIEFVEKDSVLDALLSDVIEEAQEEALDLNNYGMKQLNTPTEASDLLSKNKATILYIGSTWYSYYSDGYTLFESIQDAQKDLGFYSNYLNEYLVTSDLESALSNASENAQNYCKVNDDSYYGDEESTPTCSKYPAIYVIKDGEVKHVIKGYITTSELKSILKEYGL